MMDNMGYPKLELGLSAMTKDPLADSLAYNSLKVCILWLCHFVICVTVNYFCGSSYHRYVFTLHLLGLDFKQGSGGPKRCRG
jgi:hypothetical protein